MPYSATFRSLRICKDHIWNCCWLFLSLEVPCSAFSHSPPLAVIWLLSNLSMDNKYFIFCTLSRIFTKRSVLSDRSAKDKRPLETGKIQQSKLSGPAAAADYAKLRDVNELGLLQDCTPTCGGGWGCWGCCRGCPPRPCLGWRRRTPGTWAAGRCLSRSPPRSRQRHTSSVLRLKWSFCEWQRI